ncbi:hypothetical protein PoB_000823200 [Plakobranchus ocellatus]|uniref:Uncharacterized protein n=1 Tax=Plakobranchus ocellatus TaxID=259542 RepID=A0AAV3YHN7_9GAST|nr:hypothetical protein PoB_000823200 [Plakobranchus ocellatus]
MALSLFLSELRNFSAPWDTEDQVRPSTDRCPIVPRKLAGQQRYFLAPPLTWLGQLSHGYPPPLFSQYRH